MRRSPRKSATPTSTPTSRNEGDDERPSTSKHLHLPRRLNFDNLAMVARKYPNNRKTEPIARPKSVKARGQQEVMIVATVKGRNLRSSPKKRQDEDRGTTVEGQNLRSSPKKLQHQVAGPSSNQGAMLPPTSRPVKVTSSRNKELGTTLISSPNRSKRRREIEAVSPPQPQRQSRRRLELKSPEEKEPPVPPRRKQTPAGRVGL